MSRIPAPRLLCIALEKDTLELVKELSGNFSINEVSTEDQFFAEFEKWHDGSYALIIVGSKAGLPLANEAAQITQSQCPSTKSVFVTYQKENFVQKTLMKNGFGDAYLLPLDKERFVEEVTWQQSRFGNKKAFKMVRSLDLAPGTTLGFPTYVYLPLNNKFVLFSDANQELKLDKLKRLKLYNVTSVHIEKKDLDKFYEYTAANLVDLQSSKNGMSETEREEKLVESVRTLMFDIFDPSVEVTFDTGKSMSANCQKIVSSYITSGKSNNWYNDLIRVTGGNTGGFSHAADVSTFAFLFAVAMCHSAPEDLAMAGFLHDLGMLEVPDELIDKPRDLWTEEEVTLYEGHPLRSLSHIKTKKMVISRQVEKAILQHHEAFSGRGFPKRLPGNKISFEAQILSLADQFQELTCIKEGQQRLAPAEALSIIRQNGSINPEITNKISRLFKEG